MHASQKPTSLREQVQFVKSLSLVAPFHSYAIAVDRALEKLGNLPAWQLSKVKSKIGGHPRSTKEQMTVHCATLMDICHLKKCGVRTKISKL